MKSRKSDQLLYAIWVVGILALIAYFLSSCTAAPVQNDGDFNYRALSYDASDYNYYEVTGTVVGLPVMNDFTGVEYMPYRFLGNDDTNGSPVHVMRVNLTEDVVGDKDGNVAAKAGDAVGMKVYGSMVNSVLIGDTLTFKCRLQNEAVGAVAQQETYDGSRANVLELENCRPVSPTMDENVVGR